MKLISVIVPTIAGREQSLERVMQAYRDRTPGFRLQVINPKDYPNWPAACNVGQQTARGSYFAFGSDDLEPLDGWADAMVRCLDASELPAPQLWDFRPGGTPVNEFADGGPGSIPAFTRVVALTRAMAQAIGPWPEIAYYADNWVSDKARILGWETRVTAGYGFVHHWHQHGRLDGGDWVGRNKPLYNAERVKLGLPPI
jgi:hypothetical protein